MPPPPASSIFVLERARVWQWLAELDTPTEDSQSYHPDCAETVYLAKRLLHAQPGVTASHLFPCALACLWVAGKFLETQQNQYGAASFLGHVQCPCPSATPSLLLHWERTILEQNPLCTQLITTTASYTPLHVLYDYPKLRLFLKSASEDVQAQLLTRLLQYSKHHRSTMTPSAHFLALLLQTALALAVTFHPAACASFVQLRGAALKLVDTLQLPQQDFMSPLQQSFAQVLMECIQLYLSSTHSLYHYTLATKSLSKLLQLWHRRQYSLLQSDPVQDIVFYRSLSSWLRHTLPSDQRATLTALQSSRLPLPTLRLLCLDLLVFLRQPLQQGVPLSPAYISSTLHYSRLVKQALQLHSGDAWREQDTRTRRLAQHFLKLLLSFRADTHNSSVDTYMKSLYSLLQRTLY